MTKRMRLKLMKVISTARAAKAVRCKLHAALYSMDSRTQSMLKAQYASRLANHHTAKS